MAEPRTARENANSLTSEQIAAILPHRYPFALVDRILNIKAGSTCHDRNFSAAVNIFRCRAGKRLKPHDIEILGRL